MNRNNTSSWYPVAMFVRDPDEKRHCEGVLFGPARQRERTSYLYPNERIRQDETVIWNPNKHITVSLKSYEKAHLEHDTEALGKLTLAGMPIGCTFGGLFDWKNLKRNLK